MLNDPVNGFDVTGLRKVCRISVDKTVTPHQRACINLCLARNIDSVLDPMQQFDCLVTCGVNVHYFKPIIKCVDYPFEPEDDGDGPTGPEPEPDMCDRDPDPPTPLGPFPWQVR